MTHIYLLELACRPFPTLSPKKTLGGYLTALSLGSYVFSWFANWDVSVCAGVIVVGIAGDLGASYVP